MAKAFIKLAYKQAIDIHSAGEFEQTVFYTSYQEFLMKSQAYNMEGKFKTFDEVRKNDGRANSLHYKLSVSVTHLIEELGNMIPGLQDQLGKAVAFEAPEFKLINSHTKNRSAHTVQITYITGGLSLVCTIGDYLIPSLADQLKNTDQVDTFAVKMQPNLSICQYQSIV